MLEWQSWKPKESSRLNREVKQEAEKMSIDLTIDPVLSLLVGIG
jgi:hypothetical protein